LDEFSFDQKPGLTLASRTFCFINFLSPEKGPYAGIRKFWIRIGWMKFLQQKMVSYLGIKD
jgi:hypothetical protein